MKRVWLFAIFVLAELAWSGYSALAWLGAAFPDYADDEIFNHIKSLEISVIEWRWLAVALLLILGYLYFRAVFKDHDV